MKEGQSDLEALIKIFSKMPGLGPRSAQRLVFHLIKKREIILEQLIFSLEKINNNVKYCQICSNLTLDSVCDVCSDKSRDGSLVCVVEDISDLWAMNRSGVFNGVFHVLVQCEGHNAVLHCTRPNPHSSHLEHTGSHLYESNLSCYTYSEHPTSTVCQSKT